MVKSFQYNPRKETEKTEDDVNTLITATTPLVSTYDDDNNTLTLSVDTGKTGGKLLKIKADETIADGEFIKLDGDFVVGSAVSTLTTEQVQDIVGGMVDGGTETNISVSYDDGAGKLNFEAVNDNTQLTTEQVQDIVGGMVDGGTETNIVVSYDDAAGKLNFEADNDNTQKTDNEIKDIVGEMVSGNTEGGINVIYQSGDKTLDFDIPWFYDVKFCNFQGGSANHSFFLPFVNTSEIGTSDITPSNSFGTTNASERCHFVAPHDGRVVRICFQCENDQIDASTELKYELCEGSGGTEIITKGDKIGNALESDLNLNANNSRILEISESDGWHLDIGKSYAILLTCRDEPVDTQITIVFKWFLIP